MLNSESLKSLENCTEITRLYSGFGLQELPVNVDLSKLSKLSVIYFRGLKNDDFDIVLPESVTSVSVSNGYCPNLKNCKKINNISFPAATMRNKSYSYCNLVSEADSIRIILSWVDIDENTLSFLDGRNVTEINLTGYSRYNYNSECFNISLPKLKILNINEFINTEMKIGKVAELRTLTDLVMKNDSISDISGLENLENLTILNLSKNSISNLQSLRNLKKLQSLDLSNNLIYNTSTVVDEKNQNVTINNLEILGNLNPLAGNGGVLTKLYLEGNTGITDFSLVSKYTNWVEKSGF